MIFVVNKLTVNKLVDSQHLILNLKP